MIPQRTAGYKVIVKPIAENRIKLNQCPGCGLPKEKWKRRKDWTCCSANCTDIYWKKLVICFDWQSMRKKVFERDKHRCVECGSDGITHTNYEYVELDADHIIPIALGGDEWEIDNLQTLCKKCHKIKTKKDMGKIAIARRIDNQIKKGQKLLSMVNV